MNASFTHQTCSDFVRVLASPAPVPGGGGAAALTGAIGAALASMVGNLTIGRKKYAIYKERLEKILEQAEKIETRLLEQVDKDAECFEPLSRAYSIPKDDPSRKKTLEDATIAACQAPAEIMRLCCEAIELLEELLEKGSVMLVSDVGCGALCCAAALESASLNIFINTKALQNRKLSARIDSKADTLLLEYLPRARAISDEVIRRLRNGV